VTTGYGFSNVVVYEEDDGSTVVSALNRMVALGVVDNPGLEGIAAQVVENLQRVVESLI
jgi:hypothetical protein